MVFSAFGRKKIGKSCVVFSAAVVTHYLDQNYLLKVRE